MTEESEIKRDLPRSAPGPAPGQNEKNALFQGKKDTFEVTEGGLLEMCSSKIVKSSVFQIQETLFEERSSPMSLLPGPEANKSGGHKLQIVNNCLTSGRGTFWSAQVLQPHDLRRMKTN